MWEYGGDASWVMAFDTADVRTLLKIMEKEWWNRGK